MNSSKRNKILRIVIPGIALGLFLFVGSAHTTHAFPGVSTVVNALADISYTIVGKIAFGISYIIAYVVGVIVAIEAWLIGIVLNINTGVFNSAIVQNGFSVTLAVANLGFVLGIIIIALATIVRSQTYGVKQLLWKLVVAAILVNFSLVIAAPIFNFGNSLTQYFLNCIDPANGGCNGNLSGFTTMNDFAKNLSGAFNPQAGLIWLNKINNASDVQGAFAAAGSDISKMLLPLASVIFVAIQLSMIVIVLGVLIALLLIRYIYIAILAILMPFAWLMWIFPKMKHHWDRWWSEFIRWTFFAPIVVFFLWLAMATMSSMNTTAAGGSQSFVTYTSSSNPLMASISNFFGNLFTPIVQNFLNMIVMVGLSIGGMVVANAMGIKGAGAAIGGAKWVSGQVTGYAGKQTKKGARLAYQKAGGEKFTTRLKEGRLGILGRIPLARRGASLAGRGISNVSSNAAIVADAQKRAPKSWEEAKVNATGSMNQEDQFAHIAVGVKEGKIKADDMFNGKKVADIMDNADLIKRYGQEKLLKDFNNVVMSTTNSRNAQRAIDADPTGKAKRAYAYETMYEHSISAGNSEAEAKNFAEEEAEKAVPSPKVIVAKDIKDEKGNIIFAKGAEGSSAEVRKAADKEMFENAGKGDFSKANVNDLFGASAALEEFQSRLKNIAEYAPQIVPNLIRGMKSPALSRFTRDYPIKLNQVIKEYEKRVKDLTGDTTGELEKATLTLTRAKAAQKSFDRVERGIFGSATGGESGGGKGGTGGGGGEGGGQGH